MKKALLLLLFFSSSGYCERYSFLVSSDDIDMEEDAGNLITGYSLFNRAVEYIPGLKERKAVRIGKFFLLDYPISIWTTVLHHEYFGHGGRAREHDVTASYKLYSPWEYWPFDNKRAYVHYEKGYPEDIDKRLSLTLGGIESNNVLAQKLERKIYKDGKISYHEALFFLSNKLYLNTYIYRTPDPNSDPEGFRIHGDISAYLIEMDIKRGEEGSAESAADDYRRLKKNSLYNLADPILWVSVYSIGRYLVAGEKSLCIPYFNHKSTRFLPSARFNITPIGEEYYLDLYVKRGLIFFAPHIRYGKGPEGRFYGAGIEINGEMIKKGLLISSEIDWWHQPITENGYHVAANLTKHITDWIAIVARAGFKDRGYLMGKEFNRGRYGACGIDLVF
ncbi:MAG: hypothetical protein QME07_06105 [bacterium]|nr:hypothetical protein [bacterium]